MSAGSGLHVIGPYNIGGLLTDRSGRAEVVWSQHVCQLLVS
jgi:hypothetical protein